MHFNASKNTGATVDEISEALMHVAVYVPASNNALKILKECLKKVINFMSINPLEQKRLVKSSEVNISLDYKSTKFRNPKNKLIKIENFKEIPSPKFSKDCMRHIDADLTKNAKKDHDPIGERIIIIGKVMDEFGRAVPDCLFRNLASKFCW